MLDSLLTMTKRGAFWLAVMFAVALAFHFGVSAMIGVTEPIFLLIALALALAFVVTAAYTAVKTIFRRNKHSAPPTEDS